MEDATALGGSKEDDKIGRNSVGESGYSARPNVKEEKAGAKWDPDGGEFVVLSLIPDDYDGGIANPHAERPEKIQDGSLIEEMKTREAAAIDIVALVLGRAEGKEYASVNPVLDAMLADKRHGLIYQIGEAYRTRRGEFKD